jgi:hypothetical protein
MAQPKYIEKYLRIKPEVDRIFDDLEGYKNFCRFNMLKFDERDLYKSEQYRKFEKYRNWRNKQFDKQQNNF